MSTLRAATVLSLSLAVSTPALAADAGTPPAAPAPASFRSDLSSVLTRVEKQTVLLEQAIPPPKFTWRPSKGVRSVSEVYLHIAGGIYFLAGKIGHAAPADVSALMQAKKWESQTTKKDEIKTVLTNAYAFMRKAIEDTSDADLEKTVDFFGTPMTQRAVLLVILSHCSEHLGQSIAYARSNGVVPPWSKPGSTD
jgi:uncharacterized damage-inducible protein DinB